MLASQGGKRRRDQPKGWTWRERWTRGRGSHSTLAADYCHGCSESRNAYIDLKRGNPERQTPRDRVRRPPPAAGPVGKVGVFSGMELALVTCRGPQRPGNWKTARKMKEHDRPTSRGRAGRRAAGGGQASALAPPPRVSTVQPSAASGPPCHLASLACHCLPLPAWFFWWCRCWSATSRRSMTRGVARRVDTCNLAPTLSRKL